jgi:hypothetical protein
MHHGRESGSSQIRREYATVFAANHCIPGSQVVSWRAAGARLNRQYGLITIEYHW